MKKNNIKIVLDLLMALAFALLMNPRVLNGLPFHEIAGLILGVAILTHIGLNYKWVMNTTLKIFDTQLPKKTRWSYLLNILLLISMSTIIITGIFISKVVFPNLAIEGNRMIRGLHDLSSNLTLALVGLHIGIHWQWVMGVCKKMFKTSDGKLRKGILVSALFSLLVLAGGIQWFSSTTSLNMGSNLVERQNLDQPLFSGISRDENNLNQDHGKTSDFQEDNPFQRRHGRGEFGHRGPSNSFLVILTYFVIWAALIIPTFYFEKRISRKRSKLSLKDAIS